ncbi:hypothetical protein [Actinokineospora spheciospongiae]|uniref:hypothetical protein n=1 Tax=Actinokineospora spheciospongiae TaxID=909613 RepID=UPI000D898B9E|nr:hypothetical protein [Actinokineospora spheciospongiae]PWW53672.1 hypothetical protein DFQ13_11555 [Actinokineospora spheciospongiae]
MAIPTFDRPPALEKLAADLRDLVVGGLPATEETASVNLIGLRGVWARAVDAEDMTSRVKALNQLLKQEIERIPADTKGRDWSLGAKIIFGLAAGSRRANMTDRRDEAARTIGYNEAYFRTDIVPKILKQLARQLREDSLNYVPRNREVPPRQEISGDTPSISEKDISSRDRILHEERISRLWEYVYGLRAEMLAIQRHKTWPENEYNAEKLEEARMAALWQLARTMNGIQDYISEYGERILMGEAEYTAARLIALAGWKGELPAELAYKLRLLAQQHPIKESFVAAVKAQGIRMASG